MKKISILLLAMMIGFYSLASAGWICGDDPSPSGSKQDVFSRIAYLAQRGTGERQIFIRGSFIRVVPIKSERFSLIFNHLTQEIRITRLVQGAKQAELYGWDGDIGYYKGGEFDLTKGTLQRIPIAKEVACKEASKLLEKILEQFKKEALEGK